MSFATNPSIRIRDLLSAVPLPSGKNKKRQAFY
jgi:hypothetical protein